MKRQRVIVGLVVLALAAVLAVALWPHGPRPCRATFEQVRQGMTYDEVCATVGGPPGNHAEGVVYVDMIDDSERLPTMWWADDGVLLIDFCTDGRAGRIQVVEPTVSFKPSLLGRLRDRLGL